MSVQEAPETDHARLLDAATLPYYTNPAYLAGAGLESSRDVLLSCIPSPDAPLRTLCARYSQQLAVDTLADRGLFAQLTHLEERPAFLSPAQWALWLGATRPLVLLPPLEDVFAGLGNSISVPQAAIPWAIMLSLFGLVPHEPEHLVLQVWRSRMWGPQLHAALVRGWYYIGPLGPLLDALPAPPSTHQAGFGLRLLILLVPLLLWFSSLLACHLWSFPMLLSPPLPECGIFVSRPMTSLVTSSPFRHRNLRSWNHNLRSNVPSPGHCPLPRPTTEGTLQECPTTRRSPASHLDVSVPDRLLMHARPYIQGRGVPDTDPVSRWQDAHVTLRLFPLPGGGAGSRSPALSEPPLEDEEMVPEDPLARCDPWASPPNLPGPMRFSTRQEPRPHAKWEDLLLPPSHAFGLVGDDEVPALVPRGQLGPLVSGLAFCPVSALAESLRLRTTLPSLPSHLAVLDAQAGTTFKRQVILVHLIPGIVYRPVTADAVIIDTDDFVELVVEVFEKLATDFP